MVRKFLSFFIILVMVLINIPSISFAASSNSVELNIPDTRFDIRQDITISATISGDFTLANVIFNGEIVNTFSQSFVETYEITIGADVEKYIDKNELKLEVEFADGSKKTASGIVTTYSPIDISLIKTDMTKVPSDFPAGTSANAHAENLWHSLTGMSCKYDEPRGAKLYMISAFSDGTTEYRGNFFKVAKENGTSAELNLQTDVFETMSTGIIRVTYDVFITGNITRTRFQFAGFKNDGTTSGSKNYDMNNFVNNKWNKLTLDFNLDDDTVYYNREAEGETKHTASVYVSPSSDVDTVNKFRLVLITDSTVSDQAYIFKNISVDYLTGRENTISLINYTMPNSEEFTPDDSKVHADAQKLTLTASDDITSADGLDIISETGEKIEGVAFTTLGNIIEVSLPDGGVPNGNFKIVLGKNTKLAKRDVNGKLSANVKFYQDTKAATSAGLMVGDTALTSAQQITTGSVIKTNIVAKNNKNEETKLVYVITLRDGSRLVSMNAKSVTLPPLDVQPDYEESFTLELPEITKSGNYKVYLIAIDSYSNSVAVDDCLSIE